jgi:thioredoxin 1
MAILEINEADFDSSVNGEKAAVVYIWAPWCGPCKMMSPVVGLISEDFAEKADFFKLNADEAPAILERFGISGTPTTLVFKGGELLHSVVGAKPKALLVEILNNLL